MIKKKALSWFDFTSLPNLMVLFVSLIFACSSCKVKPSTNPNMDKQKDVKELTNKGALASDNKTGEKLSGEKINLPFSLLESFSQEWTSGIAGGGRSTEYSFRLIINTADKIDFDSAWIGNNAFKVYLANASKVISNRPVTIAQNDTATVRVSFSSNAKPNYAPAPVNFTGAALISYRLNGKTNYFEIGSIEKKPPILGQ